MIFALIVVPVIGLFFGVHRYLWCRLVRDTTTPGSRLRRAGTVAAFVLPLTAFGALLSGRSGAPLPVQQALAWPGYLWLALVLYLTLALLVGEVVRRCGCGRPGGRGGATAGRTPAPRTTGRAEPSRRPRRNPLAPPTPQEPAPTLLPPGTSALPPPAVPTPPRLHRPGGRGRRHPRRHGHRRLRHRDGPPRTPRIKRVTVPLAKLPRAAHGFRIAVVSDIHLGPDPRPRAHPAHRRGDQPHRPRPGGHRRRPGGRQRRRPRPRRRTPARTARPARRVLRHRQPRVLLGRRPVGRPRKGVGCPPAGERPHRTPRLRPRRHQRRRRASPNTRAPTTPARWAAGTPPAPSS